VERLGSGSAAVEELEWGSPGYVSEVRRLALAKYDYVLAADCCYIDNEGASPSTAHFIRTCAMLVSGGSPKCRCLVSFELRAAAVKATFLSEAARRFRKVLRVPVAQLPRGCQVEHIELYELSDVITEGDLDGSEEIGVVGELAGGGLLETGEGME